MPPDSGFVVATVADLPYKREMRLLVTGGCGFLGSNFVRHVLEHYRSALITNVDALTYAGNLANVSELAEQHANRYDFFQADIASAFHLDVLFRKHHYYAVVNFAAESHVDRSIDSPQNFIHTNILGTNILLDAARAHGVRRFLQISTTKVYGPAGDGERFAEDRIPSPTSPYAASKASADMLALTAWKTYGLETVIVRPSNVYGPFQHPEKLLPHLITRFLDQRPVDLYGDGLNAREWVHVADVCSAIMTCLLEAAPGSVFNVNESDPIANLDLAHRVAALTGVGDELIRFVPERPANDRRSSVSSQAMRTELGWAPLYQLGEGLRRTVDWYAEHRPWWEMSQHTTTRP